MSTWITFGQTYLAAGTSIDDPAVNALLSLPGQLTSLPYVVPEGKILTIDSYGCEGYNAIGIFVIFPWIEKPNDTPPAANALPATWSSYRAPRSLASCAAQYGSKELAGCNAEIAEGYKVHIRLINGSGASATYGWYAKGTLRDAA